ncbi:hypothetical protein EHS25_008285 [Saitozyma podzolica]|uniref:Uncharacterized protein n=1 Tax=Saitozyma podzolica TaxID=1890683 RepID=A0A427YP41_9TREE|nr:hypothetical protein EHS25_008285 [Saitozyma podzolica]
MKHDRNTRVVDMSTSLFISYSSPLFSYSGTWLSSSSSSAFGSNSTAHETTGPSTATLSDVWATGLTPYWDDGDSYTVSMQVGDGAAQGWIAGDMYTQNFTQSTFQLEVACTASGGNCATPLSFTGVMLQTEVVPTGSAAVNVTIDNASSAIVYQGWTSVQGGNNPVEVSSEDYDGTLSMTTTAGASATITFVGSAILVYGVTAPSLGPYTSTLDGTSTTYSAANNITAHAVVLFFATALDTANEHTLVLAAGDGGGGGQGLVLDRVIAYGTSGSVGFIGSSGGNTTTIGPSGTAAASGSSTTGSGNSTATGVTGAATSAGGTSAGTIIGALLGTLAGLLLLFFLFRKVAPKLAKPSPKELNPWDEANLLQNMKQENVHITTVAQQRYVYPGLIAHSELKK